MSKDQEVIEYKVGIFVLAGLLILGTCIFLLGGESSVFTEYYQLHVKMKNVQGVQNGSVVSLAGIKVGNVTEIQFRPNENILQLSLRIDKKYQERIRTNATASLKTRGVLGDQFIHIDPGTFDYPAMQPGSPLRVEEDGGLLSRLSDGGDELENIFEILQEVKVLMQRINAEGRSAEMMENFAESSETLKEALKESKKLLLDLRANLPENGELKKSADRLSSILKKVDEGKGTLGALINDPGLYQRLSALLGGEKRPQHLKSLIREAIQTHEESEKE